MASAEIRQQSAQSTHGTNGKVVGRPQLQMVIVGHVDHGKSTIIGRLLADTNSLPDGKLEAVKAACERNSKPFEYAFLIDALKDEQAQGITIDSARVFFSTASRDYIIIDAPGHIEFLKNMVTGASRADVAFLVIDAHEGIQENSRRHGYLLSMLGVQQLAVLVNKMDLVDYDQKVFRRIVRRYRRFLKGIDIDAETVPFIPVSGIGGDNIVAHSEATPWYDGPTAIEQLDAFTRQADLIDLPFRMPIQGIYKFTKYGDARRIVAGTIGTGTLRAGDEVVFYPSGKRSRVEGFERFSAEPVDQMTAPNATGFTISEQLYITRGQIAARADETAPIVANRIRANLFWLGRTPMERGKEYVFKSGTCRAPVRLVRIVRVLDGSSLKSSRRKATIERHDVAEVELVFDSDIAFDPVQEIASTSRFVIVDDYEIRGGGIIKGQAEDAEGWIRENVRLRNFSWDRSAIQPIERAERYNQRATLVLLTGKEKAGKHDIARSLEEQLFQTGKFVYHLGVGNIQRGLSADIQEVPVSRDEHIRRLAEVSHLFLDSGVILIVTINGLTQEDLDLVRVPVNPDSILTVWVGESAPTGLEVGVHVDNPEDISGAVDKIAGALRRCGAIYSPY